MKLKIVAYNAQDFFAQPIYELRKTDIASMTEVQWQQLAPDETRLKPLIQMRGLQQMIAMEDPDIIGVCEIGGRASLENFNSWFLEERYQVLLVEGYDRRGIDTGFMVKKGLPLQLELISHRDWVLAFTYPHEEDPAAYPIAVEAAAYRDLGPPDDRRLSRDAPALLVRDAEGALLLIMIMVHLKSGMDMEGFDPGGQVRRAAELSAVLDIRAALQDTYGPVPIMIMGDFNGNASPEETTYEFEPIYNETTLDDVLELAGLPYHERLTHFTFFNRELMYSQLDYIFVPPVMHPWLVRGGSYVHRYRSLDDQKEVMFPNSFEERRRLPSDHYPVVCVLDLP